MESSSVPSPPWTSQARSVPRLARVSAIGRSQRAEKAPVSCRFTPAGLVIGPSRLNSVRVPSSVRAGPTKRIAGWCMGAIMKAIPASSSACCATSAGTITFTPMWESASAAPDFELRLRLPCLATGTPAPAATSAAAVEMLSVPLPSPPVPTMSIAPSGARTRVIFERMTATAAVISSTVSPRVRSAIRKPPIWAGVASPDMIASKAPSASVRVRGPSAALPISGRRLSDIRRPP